jgi:hypothetical protein
MGGNMNDDYRKVFVDKLERDGTRYDEEYTLDIIKRVKRIVLNKFGRHSDVGDIVQDTMVEFLAYCSKNNWDIEPEQAQKKLYGITLENAKKASTKHKQFPGFPLTQETEIFLYRDDSKGAARINVDKEGKAKPRIAKSRNKRTYTVPMFKDYHLKISNEQLATMVYYFPDLVCYDDLSGAVIEHKFALWHGFNKAVKCFYRYFKDNDIDVPTGWWNKVHEMMYSERNFTLKDLVENIITRDDIKDPWALERDSFIDLYLLPRIIELDETDKITERRKLVVNMIINHWGWRRNIVAGTLDSEWHAKNQHADANEIFEHNRKHRENIKELLKRVPKLFSEVEVFEYTGVQYPKKAIRRGRQKSDGKRAKRMKKMKDKE